MTQAGTPPSTADYRAAAEALCACRAPLLLTHERPDGDALGCLLAMHAILRDRGIQATAVVYEPIPQRYAFMDGASALHILANPSRDCEGASLTPTRAHAEQPLPPPPTITPAHLTRADIILVMDTCSVSQLTPVADFLRTTTTPIIALDHHRTRDLTATRYLIDPEAAAAALLLYDWARAAGWDLPEDAQTALFIGIATDTGWFRFSNTSPAALRAAADLVERGVDLDQLHQRLYLADPVRVLEARALAMSKLEIVANDRVALMPITAADLAAIPAVASDLEEVVNAPLAAAAIQVSVLLVERPDGTTKASLRSKGQVDVAAIAARFGGGGHARASGARLPGPLAQARAAILTALTDNAGL